MQFFSSFLQSPRTDAQEQEAVQKQMSCLINKNMEYCHQQNLQNLDNQYRKKDHICKR